MLRQFKNINGQLQEIPIDWEIPDMIAALKQLRDLHLSRGALLPSEIAVDARVQTTEEAKTNLIGSIEYCRLVPDATVNWSLGGGRKIEAGLATLLAMGQAQFTHTQVCHNRYLELYELSTQTATYDERRELVSHFTEGWPV